MASTKRGLYVASEMVWGEWETRMAGSEQDGVQPLGTGEQCIASLMIHSESK